MPSHREDQVNAVNVVKTVSFILFYQDIGQVAGVPRWIQSTTGQVYLVDDSYCVYPSREIVCPEV